MYRYREVIAVQVQCSTHKPNRDIDRPKIQLLVIHNFVLVSISRYPQNISNAHLHKRHHSHFHPNFPSQLTQSPIRLRSQPLTRNPQFGHTPQRKHRRIPRIQTIIQMTETNIIPAFTNIIIRMTKRHNLLRIHALNRSPILRVAEEHNAGDFGGCVCGQSGGGEMYYLGALGVP
jgi:hypothetical protein